MPTVLRIEGLRFFFFFSNERGEPPHVHVEKAEAWGKWWLDPLAMAYSKGFSASELRRVRELVFAHRREILERWNEHFGN